MSEILEEKKTSKKEEPAKHEISLITLNTLVNGYLREIISSKQRQVIASLCVEYYPKQLYMMLLNAKTLQLTLCDTSKCNVQISSNKCTALNDSNSKHIAVNEIGFCFKENIKINNLSKKITNNINAGNNNKKYNAIFKCGGGPEKRDYFSDSYSECGMLLYENEADLNLYYYELPKSPFRLTEYSNALYSDIYGLITFGLYNHTGKIAILDINQSEELKWDIQTLPNALFPMELKIAPSGCLINGNEKELFFINGGEARRKENLKATIYNLETKQCSVVHKKNPWPATECGITYCYNTNKIYIGGGQNIAYRQQIIQYYDLKKNKYFDLPTTNKPYERPTLKIDKSGVMLYISCIDSWNNDIIYFESIDLRAANEWKINNNLDQFSKQLFQTQKYKHFSIVNLLL